VCINSLWSRRSHRQPIVRLASTCSYLKNSVINFQVRWASWPHCCWPCWYCFKMITWSQQILILVEQAMPLRTQEVQMINSHLFFFTVCPLLSFTVFMQSRRSIFVNFRHWWSEFLAFVVIVRYSGPRHQMRWQLSMAPRGVLSVFSRCLHNQCSESSGPCSNEVSGVYMSCLRVPPIQPLIGWLLIHFINLSNPHREYAM